MYFSAALCIPFPCYVFQQLPATSPLALLCISAGALHIPPFPCYVFQQLPSSSPFPLLCISTAALLIPLPLAMYFNSCPPHPPSPCYVFQQLPSTSPLPLLCISAVALHISLSLAMYFSSCPLHLPFQCIPPGPLPLPPPYPPVINPCNLVVILFCDHMSSQVGSIGCRENNSKQSPDVGQESTGNPSRIINVNSRIEQHCPDEPEWSEQGETVFWRRKRTHKSQNRQATYINMIKHSFQKSYSYLD